MSHDELADLVTGYALAALDPEELAAFEAHLPTCSECAQRVAEMQALAGVLPHLLEEIEPPVGLKGRILAAVREESETTVNATHSPGRWNWLFARSRLVATAMVVLMAAVIGLAVWDIRPDDDASVIRDRLELSYDAIAIMAQAEQWWRFTGTDAAADASGTLAYSEEHGAACLFIWGLPSDEGQRYQAWITKDGEPTLAGRMWRVESYVWLILEVDPSELDKIEITPALSGTQSSPPEPVLVSLPLSQR